MLVLTSLSSIDREWKEEIEPVLEGNLERVKQIVLQYMLSEITPGSTDDFEKQLAGQLRELARRLVERVFNRLESDDHEQAPHDVKFEAGGYRRRNQKTRNSKLINAAQIPHGEDVPVHAVDGDAPLLKSIAHTLPGTCHWSRLPQGQ